MSELATELL